MPVSPIDIDQWHRQRNFKRAYAARLGEDAWSGKGQHAVGLAAIGYHFVIDINGTDKFTPALWAALKTHVESLQQDFHPNNGHKPGLKVIGHRDIDDGKECPGFDVAAWIKNKMAAPPENTITPVGGEQ